jgi:hypothetical protein
MQISQQAIKILLAIGTTSIAGLAHYLPVVHKTILDNARVKSSYRDRTYIPAETE